MHGIAANVGNDNTARFACREVYTIGSRGRDRDQFQIGQPGKSFGVNRHLVDEGHGGPGQASDDLVRPRPAILDPFVGKGRTAHAGNDEVALKLDNAHDQGAFMSNDLPAASAIAPTCAPRAALPQ